MTAPEKIDIPKKTLERMDELEPLLTKAGLLPDPQWSSMRESLAFSAPETTHHTMNVASWLARKCSDLPNAGELHAIWMRR